jgi:hypothetical protein
MPKKCQLTTVKEGDAKNQCKRQEPLISLEEINAMPSYAS